MIYIYIWPNSAAVHFQSLLRAIQAGLYRELIIREEGRPLMPASYSRQASPNPTTSKIFSKQEVAPAPADGPASLLCFRPYPENGR